MQETQVQSLGQENPLEKEMATHSSILAREIPWTEEPGGLQSMGLQSWMRLSVVQSLSHVWLFVTPWTATHQAFLSFISRSLLRLLSIESVMPSNHLILCHPLHFLPSLFPSIRVFSSESAPCIKWPQYWSFSFRISPSNEYWGLIFFRIDWFDLFAVQGTLKSLLQYQFKSIKSLVLSLLYGPNLTSTHDCWKKYSFDYMDLCKQSDVSAF